MSFRCAIKFKVRKTSKMHEELLEQVAALSGTHFPFLHYLATVVVVAVDYSTVATPVDVRKGEYSVRQLV